MRLRPPFLEIQMQSSLSSWGDAGMGRAQRRTGARPVQAEAADKRE
jgi:hypothetical protein